jgi:phenylpropionate dioxygenase-like ring-hydroxylating dioxygenase large terminal subunit
LLTSIHGNDGFTPTPVADIAYRNGALVFRKDSQESKLPPAVNPTKSQSWSLDINLIFPAFFVNVSEGSYFTHLFTPIALDKTLWTSTQYYSKAQTVGQRLSQEYGNAIFRAIITEDGRAFEEMQSVLLSGAKTEFPLHDEEILIRQSHHVVNRMINGQPVETPVAVVSAIEVRTAMNVQMP